MSDDPKLTLHISSGSEEGDAVSYRGALFKGLLDVGDELELKPLGAVTYDLNVQVLGSELLIQGRVEGGVEMSCARCAEFYSTILEDSAFVRCFDLSETPEEVEIGEDIREALLLQVPSFPLCKKECLGLCPTCGVNLNTMRCSCEPVRSDGRWDELDGLTI